MTEQSEFIVRLKQILSEVGSITDEESKKAYILIKGRLWESKRQIIRSKGLCINCQSVEIEYGAPTKILMLKGDKWIDSVFKNWIWPPIISADQSGTNIKINGFVRNTIQPYLCAKCDGEIQRSIDEVAAHRVGLNNQQAIRQRDYEFAIVHGEKKATPEIRYWALYKHFDPQDVIKLKMLPYNDFLKTI